MKKLLVMVVLLFGLSAASYAVRITLRNSLQSPLQVVVRQKGRVVWSGRIRANDNASFHTSSGRLHIRYIRANGTVGLMTPMVNGIFMLFVLL